MFRSKQAKLTEWLYAVTVAAAILAFLCSTSVAAPQMHHRDQPEQFTNELVANPAVVGDALVETAPEADCHAGQSCLTVIVPSDSLMTAGMKGSLENPTNPHFQPTEVRHLLFHPPRILSQV